MFLSRKKPPLIGLDISSTSVKLMELSKTGSTYRIEGIGVEPLPANAVVEKNVAEVESVGESVKRALAKSKIKSKYCAIAVSGSSVITKKITMPASLSEDEMEGNIQLEADQYIPYPLEEVNLDFHVLGETENNPETVDVLLYRVLKAPIAAPVLDHLLHTSGGLPGICRQLVEASIETGALAFEDGVWRRVASHG